jgi:hypothetical protein
MRHEHEPFCSSFSQRDDGTGNEVVRCVSFQRFSAHSGTSRVTSPPSSSQWSLLPRAPSLLRQHPVLLVGKLTEAQRSHFPAPQPSPARTRDRQGSTQTCVSQPLQLAPNLTAEEGTDPGSRAELVPRPSREGPPFGLGLASLPVRVCAARERLRLVQLRGRTPGPCEMGGRGPAAGVWGRVSGKAGFVCLRGAFWLAGEVWGRWRQYCWDGVVGGGGV